MKIGWRFAGLRARAVRALYLRTATRPTKPGPPVDFAVISYSSERDLPEQVASIRSFLLNVGVPRAFTVVSDGTHTEASIRTLTSLHPCIRVRDVDHVARPTDELGVALPAQVRTFLDENPTGKKLRMLVSMAIEGTTIYCDSDVLFFPGASELREPRYRESNYYLADCEHSLEEALLEPSDDGLQPVNSGFCILNEPLYWDSALQRLSRPTRELGYWPEQTILHLAAHDSGATPLDPNRFVLKLDDKWSYNDRYVGEQTVLRHYVGGLKPKMWTVGALFALPASRLRRTPFICP